MKSLEQKVRELNLCLERGAYEDAMCHAADLFHYCFDRFKLVSGHKMSFVDAIGIYLLRPHPDIPEGPSVLDEVVRRLDAEIGLDRLSELR